jgi:hypothetical protein
MSGYLSGKTTGTAIYSRFQQMIIAWSPYRHSPRHFSKGPAQARGLLLHLGNCTLKSRPFKASSGGNGRLWSLATWAYQAMRRFPLAKWRRLRPYLISL